MAGALLLQYPTKFRHSSTLLSSSGTLRIQSQCLRGFIVGFPARRPRKQLVVAPAASMENSSPFSKFMGKIVSSLPVVGLLARLGSDEGGVGDDAMTYGDFFKRAEKRCTPAADVAFTRFKERHGKTGSPQFVLIWCWATTVGAGLLKTEDLELAALRLRASYDLVDEVELFDALMNDALEKRKKSSAGSPGDVPGIARAEKALDCICICCIGNKSVISNQDANLLTEILCFAFPTVEKPEIEALTKLRTMANIEA